MVSFYALESDVFGRFPVENSSSHLLAQPQLLCTFVIHKQLPKSRPPDERVEDALIILVGHANHNGFQHKIAVDGPVGLAAGDVVKFAEKAQSQELLSPQGLAIVAGGLGESAAQVGQH